MAFGFFTGDYLGCYFENSALNNFVIVLKPKITLFEFNRALGNKRLQRLCCAINKTCSILTNAKEQCIE